MSKRKTVFRIISFFIVVVITVFGLTIGVNRIGEKDFDEDNSSFKGILNLWHVDTFEGGTWSRKQFIMSIARQFERENPGILISVRQHTISSINAELEKDLPDIISFGTGINLRGMSELNETVSDACCINGKTYAVPYLASGYYIFSHSPIENKTNFDKITVSDSELTSPLTAFYASGYTANKVTIKSPINAFYDFATKNCEILIGTLRDANRIISKNLSVSVTSLNGYNDLYQYLSVTTESNIKKVYADKFVKLLISDGAQEKVRELSMLSPYKSLYSDGLLSECDKISPLLTVSAFTPSSVYMQLKDAVIQDKVNGVKQLKDKNLFINLIK